MSSLEDSVKYIVKDEVDDYLNSSGYVDMFESYENRIAKLQKRVIQLEVIISNIFETENVKELPDSIQEHLEEIINSGMDFTDLYLRAQEENKDE